MDVKKLHLMYKHLTSVIPSKTLKATNAWVEDLAAKGDSTVRMPVNITPVPYTTLPPIFSANRPPMKFVKQ